ncbi:MAG: glycerol-3-phosphate dehydrogenase, partial [Alphaproteobacteria bacterium]|nr:glycerol-3-phosphate dehydrogenase [Alphaproteobacteria bacterium]
IIGGGVNGCGIARDAAGRGLKVLLVEKGDLAGATSSASTKLIHGGLRYLEYYEFRLVREALAEREVILGIAPHIVRPLRFTLPHTPELRPFWMIRLGLFFYDHLSTRLTLPGTETINCRTHPHGRGLQERFKRGLVYSDCWVDDARLVVLNAIDAGERGATIRTRTRLEKAERQDGLWQAGLVDVRNGARTTVRARAVVNAAGAWVKEVRSDRIGQKSGAGIRLSKGSHIVVPRLFEGDHAFILQNDDRRPVFAIPYEDDFTLIGTTDAEIPGPPGPVTCTPEEAEYLCRAVNRFLAKSITPADIVWSYAGVRPLYDDGKVDPASITREYVVELDAGEGKAPLIDLYGGKITSYRALSEQVVDRLAPFFAGLKPAWTARAPLPGGDLANPAALLAELKRDFAAVPEAVLRGLVKRHGTRARAILAGVATIADLGADFGASLTAREVDWMIEREFATSADGILWRRSKIGLHLSPEARQAVAAHVARRLPA